jgi:hypothetical protein
MNLYSSYSARDSEQHARSTVGRGAVAACIMACLAVGCSSGSKEVNTAAASGSATGGSGAISGSSADSASGGTGLKTGDISQGGTKGQVGSGGRRGAAGKAVSGSGGGSGKTGSGGAKVGGKGGSGGGGSSVRALPAVTSVDADGPFKTEQDLAAGPSGASGLFHPTELGKDGLKHPVFVWGCGGGSNPSQYVDHLNRIASHGFVAIADVCTTAADGAPLKASLDWIIAENDRPQSIFYHKIDTAKIAMGGHSIGSVNAFAIADDPRLKTTIHVAGGSLDGQGSSAANLRNPTAYISAETDMFGNLEKAQADYDATTVPVFMTVMTGADHISAARDGLPVMVAWLRWHLGGETERRSMFVDAKGEFCSGKFVSKSKDL